MDSKHKEEYSGQCEIRYFHHSHRTPFFILYGVKSPFIK